MRRRGNSSWVTCEAGKVVREAGDGTARKNGGGGVGLTGDNGDSKPREKKGWRWLDGVHKRTAKSMASDFIEGKEGRGTHGRPDFNAGASSMRSKTTTCGRFTKLKKGKGGEGARARGGSALRRGDERGRLQPKLAGAAFKRGGRRTEVGEGEPSAQLGTAGSAKGAHLAVRQGEVGGSALRGAGSS